MGNGDDHKEHFYLTPLPVAALHHNVTGLKTLQWLATEDGIDLTDDLLGQSCMERTLSPLSVTPPRNRNLLATIRRGSVVGSQHLGTGTWVRW